MTVHALGFRFTLLDPPLFWRKLVMLVVFFGLFIPLKLYKDELLIWYVAFLVALHVYVLLVFLYRVRWRILAENRKAFALRVVAIATFVFLLTLVHAGVTLVELVLFVVLSGGIHVALLLSLTVDVRAEPSAAAKTEQ